MHYRAQTCRLIIAPTKLSVRYISQKWARRHYKRASGALLVYDVSNRSSFENAEKVWLRELKNAADSNSSLLDCLVLVGNKVGESVFAAYPATRKLYTKSFIVKYVDFKNPR